jgi:hypothetical protein
MLVPVMRSLLSIECAALVAYDKSFPPRTTVERTKEKGSLHCHTLKFSLHAKFSDPYSSRMQRLGKNILTTKEITKATKGSDIFDYLLRALRALRGELDFSCLVAALPR